MSGVGKKSVTTSGKPPAYDVESGRACSNIQKPNLRHSLARRVVVALALVGMAVVLVVLGYEESAPRCG